MAKRGFFRKVGEFLGVVKPKKTPEPQKKSPVTPPRPTEPPKPALKPFTVKSADAEERARKQRILRAKRRQLEIRHQRDEYQAIKHDRSLPPSQRAKRYQDYLRRYGKKPNPWPGKSESTAFWMRFREAGGS